MCNTSIFTTLLIIFLLILSVSGCNLKRGCKRRLWLAFRGFDDVPSRASRRRKVRHLGSLNTQALVDNTRVEQVKMLKITTECMDALDSHGIIWIHSSPKATQRETKQIKAIVHAGATLGSFFLSQRTKLHGATRNIFTKV